MSRKIEELAIRHLGHSPLRRVGRAPKFLLAYRTQEGFAKISTDEITMPSGNKAKIEILARGQQFVGYGVHPDTRREYQWGNQRPDNTPLADLPLVTGDALRGFVDEAGKLLLQAGGQGSKRGKDAKPGKTSGAEAKPPRRSEAAEERIRSALKCIPADDRQVWLDVGMALHWTGWGEPAFRLWEEWSRTTPNKYDERDQRRTWDSFSNERTKTITLGSLYSLAAQHGWAAAERGYFERGGLTFCYTSNGELMLANFTARIVDDVKLDDGSGQIRRHFVIESERFGPATVPADQFDSMNWVTREFGAQARIGVGRECKARLADAIKALSQPRSRVVYAHLGWRKIGEQWLYLHADGAIGADGPVEGIEVDPGAALSDFRLPAAADLRDAVLSSLMLLEAAPKAITWPLIGAVYLAPLSEFAPATLSVFVTGTTGARKTALALIAQAHWGPITRAPANWSSTANNLEALAYRAKDAALLVDDFVPRDGGIEAQKLHAKADQLLRV